MPKAYAVVTYRSISDPEKLAAYAVSRPRRSLFSALAFLLAATQQLPVSTGLRSAPWSSNIRA